MENGTWTQRITHLNPANVLSSHTDMGEARQHAEHLLNKDKSSLLLIVDSSDLVLSTVFDEATQRAMRNRMDRGEVLIKMFMILLGVCGCYLWLRMLSIPPGSTPGLIILGVTTLILSSLSVCSNPVELGVQLFILALMALLTTFMLKKARSLKSSHDRQKSGMVWSGEDVIVCFFNISNTHHWMNTARGRSQTDAT